MNQKSRLLSILSFIVITVFLFGCVGMQAKPTAKNFKAPVITLEFVETAHAFGYWYYSKKVATTKGTPGNVGAPLDLAFTFNIENPNDFPILLEEFKFEVSFEEFVVNTVKSTATQWIPAGKTNQITVHAHFDVRQTLLSLLVTGGFKLKEKGTNAWAQLETWWTGIPDYTIPIHVNGGSAIIKADGLGKVVTFSASFP